MYVIEIFGWLISDIRPCAALADILHKNVSLFNISHPHTIPNRPNTNQLYFVFKILFILHLILYLFQILNNLFA